MRTLFTRDLERLITELEAYPDEASIWRVRGDILNPAGTLALHLMGNLSQFVGDDLGGVPYARNRPAEFARRDVPRSDLVAELRQVTALVAGTLERLSPVRLDDPHPRPLPDFPQGMTIRYFLLHLYGHLGWHLGQVNYHRRLL
ncbi:DinB family protein [Deinococcus taeanensis]|uniref:DinB family protein n=1 Tax=Deinococcus taeanensis TaxID=2737050 RepID=UPI001CDCBF6D|nr:DinB family protein [Deinococcus taeanensis]UBV43173.1 DinB family protein [Deinococcus taeanensis]